MFWRGADKPNPPVLDGYKAYSGIVGGQVDYGIMAVAGVACAVGSAFFFNLWKLQRRYMKFQDHWREVLRGGSLNDPMRRLNPRPSLFGDFLWSRRYTRYRFAFIAISGFALFLQQLVKVF